MRMILTKSAGKRILVMHTTQDRKDAGNPYILMLIGSMPSNIKAVDFHWARAIVGRLDVVHLHWPELLLRDPARWRSCVKKALFGLMYLRLVISRTPIVQTVHNINPHEAASGYERRALAALTRRTRSWITLNPVPVEVPPGQVIEILHGHYRDWFAGCERPETIPGRYLFFGLIRPYKQVVTLIDAFVDLNDDSASLRIVGACTDPDVRQRMSALDPEQENLSAEFAYITDDRLAHEVGLAELVVLPYKEFYNSGAALLALSLGRPVLTPRNTASEILQQEFGEEWVLLYEGALSGAHLKEAMALRRDLESAGGLPDLSKREWDSISTAHAGLYAQLAG